jgi:hypothetical protein
MDVKFEILLVVEAKYQWVLTWRKGLTLAIVGKDEIDYTPTETSLAHEINLLKHIVLPWFDSVVCAD